MHVCRCMPWCGGQRTRGQVLLSSRFYSLESSFVIEPGIKLGFSKPQGSSNLSSTFLELQAQVCPCPAFHMRTGEYNSGLHGFGADTLIHSEFFTHFLRRRKAGAITLNLTCQSPLPRLVCSSFSVKLLLICQNPGQNHISALKCS